MSVAIIDELRIREQMNHPPFRMEIHESISSTNDRASVLARDGASAGTVVIAGTQTAGRGRQGRTFFSPEGTGVYMSLLLRPDNLEHPERITVTAAVAAAKAIETVSGKSAKIKWVNDVFLDGRKVCGILTEGGQTADGGFWAVLGIGVNLMPPHQTFPEELRNIAGTVLPDETDGLRERFIACMLDEFYALYTRADRRTLYDAYCSRDMLCDREVYITINGEESSAHAEGISPDFGLIVHLPDGSTKTLRSGEARARI